MKKVVVLGNGFIAAHLPYEIEKNKLCPNTKYIDWFLDDHKPDCVINATGFCGKPSVDQCETEKTKTYMANVVLPLMLAEACDHKGIQMIHLGSGCIFYGESPHFTALMVEGAPKKDNGWQESDHANPLSYYSKTKYACDLALGQMKNVCTLRLRMPISPLFHSRNLLSKIIAYTHVLDEPNSVTFTNDLVNAITWAAENSKTGIYHVTSPKPLRHSDLLNEYGKYVEHYYVPISKEELSKLVVAPRSNCILDSSKIVSEGFQFEDTDTQVRVCVQKYVENLKKQNI